MPKVPDRGLKSTRPPTETHVAPEATLLGGFYADELHTKQSLATVPEVRAAYKEASPREREHILGFLEANSKSPITSALHPFWFLVRIKDLDTGRRFLAAGCRGKGPGLTVKQFREILGVK
jgi:hypothetical protein